MEEGIERVSAILGSPVIGYTWHKTYRQMFILCLAYLLFFNFSLSAAEKENDSHYVAAVAAEKTGSDSTTATDTYSFKAYKQDVASSLKVTTNKSYSGRHNDALYMEGVRNADVVMNEVDELCKKLDISVTELVQVDSSNFSRDDRRSLNRGLAELDGIISYVETKLNYANEQLIGADPTTEEEVNLCNSVKIKINDDIAIVNKMKLAIAEKLNSASKPAKGKKKKK